MSKNNSYPDGTLIRAEGDYRIYVIFNGKRRWVKSIDVFNSYGFKWEDVEVVEPSLVEGMELNNLVRAEGDIKVYALNDSGYRRHISDPDVFNSYGFRWTDVADISSEEMTIYSDSYLIRQAGDSKVYFLENGQKRWIDSLESFYTHDLNWDEIHVINETDADSYSAGAVVTSVSVLEEDTVSIPVSDIPEGPAATTTPAVATSTVSIATTTEPIAPIATTTATTTQPITSDQPSQPTQPTSPITPAAPDSSTTSTVTTTPDVDTTPPAISNIQTSGTTATSTMITWTTDELADGKVNFGLSSSAMTSTTAAFLDAVTSHTVIIAGLIPETTYYYVVVSTDESDNTATSDVQSFTTLALPEPPADPQPQFLLKWGSYGSDDGQLNGPHGIAIDASGDVYVADYVNKRMQKFTSDGAFITKWGSSGSDDGQFNGGPHSVAIDASGNVYVTDHANHRVQKFTSDGTFIAKWGSSGSGDGQFRFPQGIAIDASGNVYVVDMQNMRVQKFTSDGAFITKWGSYGSGDGQFNNPRSIAVDNSGSVYVTDGSNHRVQKFTSDGAFITKWGSQGSGSGQFATPNGIAVNASGDIYVADYHYSDPRMQKFTSDGTFLTKWGSYGSGDGQFNGPHGVAIDAGGNIYVADYSNHRIQKFTPGSGSAMLEDTRSQLAFITDWINRSRTIVLLLVILLAGVLSSGFIDFKKMELKRKG